MTKFNTFENVKSFVAEVLAGPIYFHGSVNYLLEQELCVEVFGYHTKIYCCKNAMKKGKEISKFIYESSDMFLSWFRMTWLALNSCDDGDSENELERFLLEFVDAAELEDTPLLFTEDKFLNKVKLEKRKSYIVFFPKDSIKISSRKWEKVNKGTITRGILSGQISLALMGYEFTDDYAFDAAVNFRKEQSLDLLQLAKELWELNGTPFYLGVNSEQSSNKYLIVDYCPHSNKKIKFYVDLEV